MRAGACLAPRHIARTRFHSDPCPDTRIDPPTATWLARHGTQAAVCCKEGTFLLAGNPPQRVRPPCHSSAEQLTLKQALEGLPRTRRATVTTRNVLAEIASKSSSHGIRIQAPLFCRHP